MVVGQRPFATILGCSDSRVPPELIFDAGLGNLFVIRVAGNVFYPEIAGSLQYAGAHLNTLLFVGLGVNLKMFLALLLSGFFLRPRRWIFFQRRHHHARHSFGHFLVSKTHGFRLNFIV
jgi:hypothetical protein